MELNGCCPPIERLDAVLGTLKSCKCATILVYMGSSSLVPAACFCQPQMQSAHSRLAYSCLWSVLSLRHRPCTWRSDRRRPAGTDSTLPACRHLALSSNNIDKISSLAGLDNLQILSMGRNLLKKIENLDPVAATLTQLWISYNQIDKLVSGSACAHWVCTLDLTALVAAPAVKTSAGGPAQRTSASLSLSAVIFCLSCRMAHAHTRVSEQCYSNEYLGMLLCCDQQCIAVKRTDSPPSASLLRRAPRGRVSILRMTALPS